MKSEAKDELMRQVCAIVESRTPEARRRTRLPAVNSISRERRPGEPQFPGALPSVWNIPFRRNPHFTGRDDLNIEIEKALAAGICCRIDSTASHHWAWVAWARPNSRSNTPITTRPITTSSGG